MLKRELISILQDIIGPIFTGVMFISTFVLDLIKDTNSPLIRISVAILVLSFAAFYVARARNIWVNGSEKNKNNDYTN